MINGYEVLENKYPDFEEEQRTPNGIDLTLGCVYEVKNNGYLYGLLKNQKNIPPHILLEPVDIATHGGDIKGWILKPNVAYILEVEDKITIDPDCMQTYYPRSTLLRAGCTLNTAVGDAGYNGKLAFLFINHTLNDFVLEEGVRFAQLVDHQIQGSSKQYDGDYQNDKHKE